MAGSERAQARRTVRENTAVDGTELRDSGDAAGDGAVADDL
jgi:hypothetical protein